MAKKMTVVLATDRSLLLLNIFCQKDATGFGVVGVFILDSNGFQLIYYQCIITFTLKCQLSRELALQHFTACLHAEHSRLPLAAFLLLIPMPCFTEYSHINHTG